MISQEKCVNIKDNNGQVVNKKIKYIEYDQTDSKDLYSVYSNWVKLCASLSKLNKRTTNFPEAVSETVVAIVNKYVFLNQTSLQANNKKISTSFDCFDPITGDKIQVKACSTKTDLTSFGPKSVFDKLIFVDFYDNGNKNGNFTVYDIPLNLITNALVNATQTIANQASQNRRPRLCIKDIIANNNIQGQTYTLTSNKIQ